VPVGYLAVALRNLRAMPDHEILAHCHFPATAASVDLAVSGGPDSLGLLLLAIEAGLDVSVHHVNHHTRPSSDADARHVADVCEELGVRFSCHNVEIVPGGNFEARARAARRSSLPTGVMTGHTMDDLAETVLLNMLRGAGVDGLSPMVQDATKPLRDVRRAALHEYVDASPYEALHDETNDSSDYRRNRVRHELIAVMNDVAERDIVPVLARQAKLMHDERVWLDLLAQGDSAMTLEEADCRVVRTWPLARQRRWLREQLRSADEGDGTHPPSADEVERALGVIAGTVVATQVSGGRRLARHDQHLTLE
jgi:tRNA(Ile)-lysidine synthase